MLLTGAAVLGTLHSAAACVSTECPGVVLTCCHSVQAATVRNFFFFHLPCLDARALPCLALVG